MVRDAAAARDALVRQVSRPVRWDESVLRMVEDGVTLFVEVGVGNVLGGMIKRTTDAYFANDTSIREVLRVILTSPEMYSEQAYRWRIKSPAEQVSICAGTTMPNNRPEGCCSARSISVKASDIIFTPAASFHS